MYINRYFDNGATSFPKPPDVAREVSRYLAELGGQMMPLLRLMVRELALDLPLDEVEKRLPAMKKPDGPPEDPEKKPKRVD